MSQQHKLPAGWDAASMRALASHYDNQTEDEQAAEIEAALVAEGITMVAVPLELADEVRAFIERKQAGSERTHDLPT